MQLFFRNLSFPAFLADKSEIVQHMYYGLNCVRVKTLYSDSLFLLLANFSCEYRIYFITYSLHDWKLALRNWTDCKCKFTPASVHFFITVAFLHGEFFSFKEFSKKRADYGRHSTRNTPHTREQLVGIPFYILPIYCKLFTIHYYLTL